MAWQTVFVDGFDHYVTADILAKWSASNQYSIDSSVFRTSGKSAKTPTFVTNARLAVSIPTARNICVGFGLYLTGTGAAAALGSDQDCLLALGNSQGPSLGQCGLALLSDGKLRFARGTLSTSGFSGATQLGVAAAALPLAQWNYIELRVFIDNTAGAVELRVNGIVEFSLTGIDTQFDSTLDSATAVGLHSVNQSLVHYFDDVYIRTSNQASAETGGFFGDVKIKPYYPDADGTYAQMTPSTGTTHYTLVDEANPSTTDYVSSSTAGQKDSWSFQPVSETGSVKAVQLSVYASKDDAGFRSIDLFTKSGATEDFAASQTLSTTNKYRTKVWDNDPNTGSSWSQANVNAAEFGVRISADV